jgi:signal transduction histidine kinase
MGGPLIPDSIRQSYRAKLFLAFGFVTLVIGTAGAGLYLQADSKLQTETKTELEAAARIEAQSLDEWFAQKRMQTKAMAEAKPFYSGDDSAVVKELWTIVNRDDDIEAAYFVDTGKGTVVSSVGSSRIVSAKGVIRPSGQRDFTHRAGVGNEVLVSEPFRAYEQGAPVILLSASVPQRENRSLVTVVDLRKLSTSQAYLLDSVRYQVIDEDGTVIMAENGSRILSPTKIHARPTDDAGFVQTAYGHEETALGYASMEEQDWTVTARMPTRTAFALRSTIVEGVSWMLATVVFGLGAIALVLNRMTTSPLYDLAETAAALQEGALDRTIETDRVDEFADLYAAFDEMRVSLRDQIARTERARLESEQLTEHLQREADRFGDVMADCADGELDRRLEPSTENASMQRIAEEFNEMMDDVERQNEELEAFTSIVSHDLRNPLTVAKGRARLLDEAVDNEHTGPIVDSLGRMEQIIEDGLTLARGTTPDEVTAVDLEQRATAAWSHVESPEASLSVNETRPLHADPNLLDQLFENLFRNAVEHAGPDVRVTVGRSEHGFYVTDDGPGLPEGQTIDVFEPGVSDGSGGTGLGLTIVNRIADAHGWEVSATSGERGARFDFYLSPSVDNVADRQAGTALDG